jgi:GNAT superfamily N-acetyltransferase
MNKPDTIRVSPYRVSQRDLLLAFRRAHYGPDTYRTDEKYVDWMFADTYQRREDRSPLYVGEDEGRIVGSQGAVHFELKAVDKQLHSAWIVDFAVLRELQRSQGVGTAIAQASRDANPVRFAMNITPAAVALALKQGWRHVCELPLWARPLDVRRMIEQRSPLMRFLRAHIILQGLLDASLYVALRSAARARLHLEPTGVFDDRCDLIWRKASAGLKATCVRDHAFVKWRFDRFPRPEAYARYWLCRGEEAIGYLVLRAGRHKGLPCVHIVDFLCERVFVKSILALALNVARKQGAAIAYCITLEPASGANFRPLGFFNRRSGWRFMAFLAKCPQPAAHILAKPANWFVTMADSNLDHESAMATDRFVPEHS